MNTKCAINEIVSLSIEYSAIYSNKDVRWQINSLVSFANSFQVCGLVRFNYYYNFGGQTSS